jgi:hypothetical protein
MPGIPDMPRVSPLAGAGGLGLGGGPRYTSRSGSSPLMIILIGLLGIGTVAFAAMTFVFYSRAQLVSKDVSGQKAAAAAVARADQKKADDAAYIIANESPYRSYVAPTEFGSFEIKFPKSWSASVDQEKSGTQVKLTLNPDFIRRTNSVDELAGAVVTLKEQDQNTFLSPYTPMVKRGTLKQADMTISGQKAYSLTGAFTDKRTTRLVVVPVRDKVIVFTNENGKYADEFNQILAQSKIIP